jgi:RHS repeat-associated protein
LSKSQNFLIYSGGSYLWKPYATPVTYDLAGNVTSQTYPSGRTVNYAYDTAGRTTTFTGNLGDGTSRTYADQMSYDAAGHLTKERFGTSQLLYHNLHYNVRQQLYDNRVGTNSSDEWTWDRGALEWYYSSNQVWGGSGTDNNGNVLRADHWVVGAGGTWDTNYDYYAYDGLNRLTSVSEYSNSSSNGNVTFKFTQAFDYDAWGNRAINQAGATTSPDINKKLFSVNTTNNRLGVPSGQSGTMTYDNVGNLVTDTYTNPSAGGGMVYDAENHLTSAVNGSHKYNYNASGQRVRRSIASVGEYWMVYGLGGELVAEYNANALPGAPVKEYGYRGGQMLIIAEGANPKWLVQDHLGSTRMEIGLSGSLSAVTRHDYLPFGEELGGGVRTAPYGFGAATNTKQKFTGYERDDETGLDFAQARYMSSVQGRFTSVDPENAGADPEDPHSWNGYAYARSNPTLFTDPDGQKYLVCPPRGGGGCQLISDEAFYDARRRDEAAGFEYTGNRDFFEVGFVIFEGSALLSYTQISIDDNARQLSFEMRRSLNDPKIIAMGAMMGAIRYVQPFVPRSVRFSQLDRYSRAAAAPDRGGLTKAGRSLTKHGTGARKGNSKFPAAKGSATQINQQAQDIVDDILTNPGTTQTQSYRGRFGNTVEFSDPSGRGLVFKANGEFLFFKE